MHLKGCVFGLFLLYQFHFFFVCPAMQCFHISSHNIVFNSDKVKTIFFSFSFSVGSNDSKTPRPKLEKYPRSRFENMWKPHKIEVYCVVKWIWTYFWGVSQPFDLWTVRIYMADCHLNGLWVLFSRGEGVLFRS